MHTLHDDNSAPLETWCVCTEDGQRYVLDYARNGGFGPVNIHSNGLLVPVVYRHLLQRENTHCPVCLDPTRASTYLPPILWETPDPTRSAAPGSGDPHRGTFEAVFRGGPEHRRMWVEVFRLDWWRHWHTYAQVDLNPRSNWRCSCCRPTRAGTRSPSVASGRMLTTYGRDVHHAARTAATSTGRNGEHFPLPPHKTSPAITGIGRHPHGASP
jgi:hypothetical protein